MGVKKLLNFGGLRDAIKYVFVASKGDVLSEAKEDGGETMAELVQPLGMDLFSILFTTFMDCSLVVPDIYKRG